MSEAASVLDVDHIAVSVMIGYLSVTTLIPLILIPVISLLTKNDENHKAAFYRKLATHD